MAIPRWQHCFRRTRGQTFQRAGTSPVKLTVVEDTGQQEAVTRSVTVQPTESTPDRDDRDARIRE